MCDKATVILVLYMFDTNHECKSRTRKIVTNILSTTFVTDTKYKKCWKPCVADWNVNAPSSIHQTFCFPVFLLRCFRNQKVSLYAHLLSSILAKCPAHFHFTLFILWITFKLYFSFDLTVLVLILSFRFIFNVDLSKTFCVDSKCLHCFCVRDHTWQT